MEYVRFRSAYPNARGFHVGIFGMVNVLGRHGMLAPDEEEFRREHNAWYDAAYPEPPIYGENVHPDAAAWFKSTASELVSRVAGYLSILDAHSIAWEEVRTAGPGTIIYEDEFQVVAIPTATGEQGSLKPGADAASGGSAIGISGGQCVPVACL